MSHERREKFRTAIIYIWYALFATLIVAYIAAGAAGY